MVQPTGQQRATHGKFVLMAFAVLAAFAAMMANQHIGASANLP